MFPVTFCILSERELFDFRVDEKAVCHRSHQFPKNLSGSAYTQKEYSSIAFRGVIFIINFHCKIST